MLRKDPDARGEEYMVDEAGCDGYGQHQLCCPASQTPPTCGWYTHNNGGCNNQCPAGTKEIGSNSKYCQTASLGGSYYNYQSYQAACCTTGTENMKLYEQCSWTTWPLCYQDASCPGSQTMVASSGTGSGDAMCHRFPDPSSKRKYCCNNGDENSQWSACAWHSDLNQGSTPHPADFCHANCPDGTVRVAMDHTGCSGNSAKVECCTPNIKTISKRQTSQDTAFENNLGSFLSSPVCEGVSPLLDGAITARDIMLFTAERTTIALVTALFWGSPTTSQKDLWNRRIAAVSQFTSLSFANLHDYLTSTDGTMIMVSLGSTQGPNYITCNLNLVANTVSNWIAARDGGSGNSVTLSCACTRDDCCNPNDTECINFNPDSALAARAVPLGLHVLGKRGDPVEYVDELTDTSTTPPTTISYSWLAAGVCRSLRLMFLLSPSLSLPPPPFLPPRRPLLLFSCSRPQSSLHTH